MQRRDGRYAPPRSEPASEEMEAELAVRGMEDKWGRPAPPPEAEKEEEREALSSA